MFNTYEFNYEEMEEVTPEEEYNSILDENQEEYNDYLQEMGCFDDYE